jgi:hypothetical protein
MTRADLSPRPGNRAKHGVPGNEPRVSGYFPLSVSLRPPTAGAWLIRINSSRAKRTRISNALDMDAKGTNFFQALLDELYLREPTLRPVPPIATPEAR